MRHHVQKLLIFAAICGVVACDPNVVIGARWNLNKGGGGEPARIEEWCATAPVDGTVAMFSSENGEVIPAGSYWLFYVSGAQIHDTDIGYEVTGHYWGKAGIEAGHHVYSGEKPDSTGTHSWLTSEGLVTADSVAKVEAANRGHTWELEHAGGSLRIELYDDVYGDNSGPGSHFCLHTQ